MRPITLIFRKRQSACYSIEYLFDTLYKEFRELGLPVEKAELPYKSQGFLPRLRNVLSVSRHKNQIVHITGEVHFALLGAWWSKRVLTIHDVAFMERTSGITREFYRWFWVKLPVWFAHKVTVISENVKEDVLKYVNIPESKLEVIYDFIDDIYQPAERTFNEEKPRILQIGTKANKNLPRLIEALAGIKATLVIIGKLQEEQISLLREHKIDYINRYGLSLEELHQEYLVADLLTFASYKEGFGMPILEAQSTGLPVVTSNCSSMPEVAGDAAVYVDPMCVNSIRQGILSIIGDKELRDKLVSNGYSNVKRFSLKQVAADYARVYAELSNCSAPTRPIRSSAKIRTLHPSD